MKLNGREKGIALILISAMLWGVSGTVAQYLFEKSQFTPEWLVSIRLLLSGLILLIYAFIIGNKGIWDVWKSKYDCLNILLFGIAGMLSVQYTYFAAIKYGNAATATILQYLSPVIITCYLAIRSKRCPSVVEILSVVLAMLGTFLIITKGNVNSISISKLALFWGISSAFAAAFYTLQPKYLLNKFGSTITVAWGMLIGGIVFSFIHKPWNFTGTWSMNSVLAVIFVVLFGTLIAFYCYLESLKYVHPTEASILSSAEPLSAAILSVLWLNIPLGIAQWIGTTLIIITIVILSFTKANK
ncbi:MULTISPECIES: EamA family transporter [unclassified Clostridium]|uniref:DMT family transporter n=1 Tax=unclassified Clostridium TaxID=2614128 RepID=UPI00029825DF|nr:MULTISPECIES: EamA family transporter [unclassified Clostridium]EKQ51717.1 MAG: putative permease, DMT superfamily [Clostridium sp. Maddingley MBC34-26]